MVHSLLRAYQLDSLTWISGSPCTKQDLTRYHCPDYIDVLLQEIRPEWFNEHQELVHADPDFLDDLESFGLNYDCYLFPDIADYCLSIAGSSLLAAQQLCLRYVRSLSKECLWFRFYFVLFTRAANR